MKFAFILFTLIGFNSIAEIESANIASYSIVSDEVDSSLAENTSKFTFQIHEHQANLSKSILYSIGEEEKTVETSNETRIIEVVTPGAYDFKFVLTLNHLEIFIDSLNIAPQHHMIIQLNFRSSIQNIYVKKPVIYLYPEEETKIDIKLKVTGELSFTYPEYKDGWSVIADSLGNIECNNESFNYLFWESEQKFDQSLLSENQGIIVSQDELVSFLEESLIKFGFNSKERADFITYWVPNMKDATNLYIYFLFNEACNDFATLDISPKPAQIARFYMLWADAETNYDESGLIPQDIPTFNRDGFTVLEWGGAEIETRGKTIY